MLAFSFEQPRGSKGIPSHTRANGRKGPDISNPKYFALRGISREKKQGVNAKKLSTVNAHFASPH
jgi:hypothetical protein